MTAPANPVTDAVSPEKRRAVRRGSIMCIIGDLLSTSDASSDTSAILNCSSSELPEMRIFRACRFCVRRPSACLTGIGGGVR